MSFYTASLTSLSNRSSTAFNLFSPTLSLIKVDI
jgi:hypothetical protein